MQSDDRPNQMKDGDSKSVAITKRLVMTMA